MMLSRLCDTSKHWTLEYLNRVVFVLCMRCFFYIVVVVIHFADQSVVPGNLCLYRNV